MKWIKASERMPEKGDLYFVKFEGLDGENWFPGTSNFYDEWEKPDVIEWLDESESPASPASIEELNIAARKRVNDRMSLYSKHIFSEQEMTAMGFDMYLAGAAYCDEQIAIV